MLWDMSACIVFLFFVFVLNSQQLRSAVAMAWCPACSDSLSSPCSWKSSPAGTVASLCSNKSSPGDSYVVSTAVPAPVAVVGAATSNTKTGLAAHSSGKQWEIQQTLKTFYFQIGKTREVFGKLPIFILAFNVTRLIYNHVTAQEVNLGWLFVYLKSVS